MSTPPPSGQAYAGPERRRRWRSWPWLAVACALAVVIAFATLCPLQWRPHLTENPDQERFLAFLALGFAAKLAFPRKHLVTVGAVVALAVGLEMAQGLVPGRYSRLWDAAVKALGAVTGAQLGLAGLIAKRTIVRAARGYEQRTSVHI